MLKKENQSLRVNNSTMKNKIVGVLGAGTMGAGIAQVAAQNGHEVVLVDLNDKILQKSKEQLVKIMNRLVEKEKSEGDWAALSFRKL